MIGTGYVGLVSGVCLADFGHEVIYVDNDGAKIEMLNSGEVPIFEPNPKSLINKNVNASRLKFTTN
jgi:UDPglucose 6-dehydrogenase